MNRFNLNATLLDEVITTGAGDARRIELYDKFTFQVIAADVTDGGTVTIEVSLDGTNFAIYHTFTITEDGSDVLVISNTKFNWVRANVTARTDGTYSALMVAGV